VGAVHYWLLLLLAILLDELEVVGADEAAPEQKERLEPVVTRDVRAREKINSEGHVESVYRTARGVGARGERRTDACPPHSFCSSRRASLHCSQWSPPPAQRSPPASARGLGR
jgi:hypothetical protein